jgi:hypothetical protein
MKRVLGEPSAVVNAESHCVRSGAQTEWIYRSFESGSGRTELQDGAKAFCVNAEGKVVGKLEVVY